MSVNACVYVNMCVPVLTSGRQKFTARVFANLLYIFIFVYVFMREKEGERATMCDMQLRRLFHHVGTGNRQAPEPPDLEDPWMRLPSQVIADYVDS